MSVGRAVFDLALSTVKKKRRGGGGVERRNMYCRHRVTFSFFVLTRESTEHLLGAVLDAESACSNVGRAAFDRAGSPVRRRAKGKRRQTRNK